jgi:hypothetical protein
MQWRTVKGDACEQTDEPAAMRQGNAVGYFDAANDFPADMLVAPVGEWTFDLHIGE